MTALAAMRAQLRPHHDDIERSLDLMNERVDLPRYIRFIERSYGFIAPCERKIDCSAAPPALRLEQRLKTPLLRATLAALGRSGETIDRLPLCNEVPDLSSWPGALGYFYVLEGSTLGGQVLARHFRATLGLGDDALSFLTAYGSSTGVIWKDMIAVLESAMTDAHAAAAITESARDTFTLLQRWHE